MSKPKAPEQKKPLFGKSNSEPQNLEVEKASDEQAILSESKVAFEQPKEVNQPVEKSPSVGSNQIEPKKNFANHAKFSKFK